MNFLLPYDTPEGQREAITANDRIITVEAGAGTGKTWVLSQRYLRLLLDDDELLPSDILTLTYTEAAAGEMKARIEKLIEDSLDKFKTAERKQKVLDGLSDSWISTIHSFAGRLIRESGLSLDIDPRASVITPHQEQSFWEEIRKAVEFARLGRLAQNYVGDKILSVSKSLDSDEYMSAAVSKWGASALSDFARETAELHASSGRSWEDMLNWAEDDSSLVDEAQYQVMALLRREWLTVWNFWNKILDLPEASNPDGPGAMLNKLLDWQHRINACDDEQLRSFYASIVMDKTIRATRFEPFATLKIYLGGRTLGDWRKEQPQTVQNLTQNIGRESEKEELEMRKTLMKFCAVSWGMWDKMKSKRGLLSFSDMILHAKRTIEQKGIRRTFKHILVDEFQDTDPLQFGMIDFLRDYDKESRLFAVGDPKQSIYKFRHADPSLFAEITGRSGTRRVRLGESFRTRPKLLSVINRMFNKLWADGISRQESMKDVKYNSLSAAGNDVERESGTMPEFKIYLLRNDAQTADSKQILAENLASKISSWVEKGLTIWDKKEKIIRPVKFSDFAILARGRGSFTILEDALEKFGIPSIQDRSRDYFNRGEIGDVVCTLRAAADFNDDFSVTGWLMSPFSGVSEDEAIEKCLNRIDEAHRPVDLIRENFPDAYSLLERLAVIGENEGASGIISFYDRDRRWLSCYREKDRLRVLRNVRLSLRIARDFQSSVTSSLVSCAEYMTRSVRNDSSYDEPSWHDDDENAVRLGAVHSAKGLEYPVTVIFEDRTRKNSDSSSLQPSRELGIVFNRMPDEKIPEKGVKSKLYDWHKLLSEQGDTEEEERLFYVACTRAQDSLIFCGLIKPLDNKTGDTNPRGYSGTWSEFLLKSIEGLDDVEPKILTVDENTATPSLSQSSEEVELTVVETVKALRALRQFSATSFALYEFCPFAWRRKYRQGYLPRWEYQDRENDEESPGGAEFGSLVHWILSHWKLGDEFELDRLMHDNKNLDSIPVHIRDEWRQNSKSERSSELREWLMTFASSEFGQFLRSSKDIEREKRFRIPFDKETALAGSFDAVYRSSDSEYTVIDYKITNINSVPPGLYDSQMDFYAFVLSEIKKAERVRVLVAFLKENKTEERVITDFSSIRERIGKAVKNCASDFVDAYGAGRNHCGLCPFKKGCVKNENA